VPALASFQSINAIVNTHYVTIKSTIEGAMDGLTKEQPASRCKVWAA
jgi:hypothetical protein